MTMRDSDSQAARPDRAEDSFDEFTARADDDGRPALPGMVWQQRMKRGALGAVAVIALLLACGIGRALLLYILPSNASASLARQTRTPDHPQPTPSSQLTATLAATATVAGTSMPTPHSTATVAPTVTATPLPLLANQTTAATPALLLVGNAYFAAWTGTDTPMHHIYIAQGVCTDPAHCVFSPAIRTTDYTFANEGPSLATDGKTLYITWRGETNNVVYYGSFDGSNDLHRQALTLGGTVQATTQRPAIAWARGKLAFSWVGTDTANHVNVAYWSGTGYTKVTTTDTSHLAPVLTLYQGRLYVVFEGTDHRLHDGYMDPNNAAPPNTLLDGRDFAQLTNTDPTAIATSKGQYLVGWTGTDGQARWGVTTNPETFTWQGPLAIAANAGPDLVDAYGHIWLWWFDPTTLHIHNTIIS